MKDAPCFSSIRRHNHRTYQNINTIVDTYILRMNNASCFRPNKKNQYQLLYCLYGLGGLGGLTGGHFLEALPLARLLLEGDEHLGAGLVAHILGDFFVDKHQLLVPVNDVGRHAELHQAPLKSCNGTISYESRGACECACACIYLCVCVCCVVCACAKFGNFEEKNRKT